MVSGLVDWEMMHLWPLVFDLDAIHWIQNLKGSTLGKGYSSHGHGNADEIENRFCEAFMSSIPPPQ